MRTNWTTAALVALGAAAHAQAPPSTTLTVQQLYTDCQYTGAWGAGLCAGFVAGVAAYALYCDSSSAVFPCGTST